MYLSLFIAVLCLYGMVLHVPISAKHMCHFYNCFDTGQSPPCSSLHCYADIVCKEGRTINIEKVFYGTDKFWFSTGACRNVCYGDVAYNQTSTNEIMKLCNGLHKCSLRQWNTRTHWILDVIYDCQETITVHQTTMNVSTVTSTTPISRSNNDESSEAGSRAGIDDSSDKFPIHTVALYITTGILLLACVLIGIVCIKLRKANKKMIDTTNAQHNDLVDTTFRSDEETIPSLSTDPAESNRVVHVYATAHIETNLRSDNDYNYITAIY